MIGTGPKFGDEYEIDVELLTKDNLTIDSHKSGKLNCESDGKPTQIKVCLKPIDTTHKVRITL